MPTKDKAYNAQLVNAARALKLEPLPQVAKVKQRKPVKAGRKLIYKAELLARAGLSYPNVWQKMQDGTFPRSVAVGAKVAWFDDEFEAWLANLPRRKLKGDQEQVDNRRNSVGSTPAGVRARPNRRTHHHKNQIRKEE